MGNALSSTYIYINNAVHPHACGERGNPPNADWTGYGSSPRLWGTLYTNRHRGEASRFIPTLVGNAYNAICLTLIKAVHPHACGERFHVVIKLNDAAGSSPRLWGTLNKSYQRLNLSRFIPTLVGNANQQTDQKSNFAVHPHACGERSFVVSCRPP